MLPYESETHAQGVLLATTVPNGDWRTFIIISQTSYALSDYAINLSLVVRTFLETNMLLRYLLTSYRSPSVTNMKA